MATGIAHLLAGLAIVSGILAVLASRLLTLMILLFGVFIWLPALFANPHTHMTWAANGINLALAGAAWVIADWIAGQEREGRRHQPLQAIAVSPL